LAEPTHNLFGVEIMGRKTTTRIVIIVGVAAGIAGLALAYRTYKTALSQKT
jgi:hypothetical protein